MLPTTQNGIRGSESPGGSSPQRRRFPHRPTLRDTWVTGAWRCRTGNDKRTNSRRYMRSPEARKAFTTHNINTTCKPQFSPPWVLQSHLLLETASEEQVPVSTYLRLMHNSSKLKFLSPRRPTSIRPTQISRVPCSTPCGMRVGSRGGLCVAQTQQRIEGRKREGYVIQTSAFRIHDAKNTLGYSRSWTQPSRLVVSSDTTLETFHDGNAGHMFIITTTRGQTAHTLGCKKSTRDLYAVFESIRDHNIRPNSMDSW